MLLSNYIIYGIIIIAVFTLYMAIIGLLGKDKIQERAKNIGGAGAKKYVDSENADEKTTFSAFCEQAISAVGIDANKQSEVAAQLAAVGLRGHNALVCFLFFQRIVQPALLSIGLIIVVGTFGIANKTIAEAPIALILSFIFVAAGAVGSKLFIDKRKEKRQKIIIKTFPEALDLMLICVESGLGIDAALGRVCREIKSSHPIIADEFERTRFEMSAMSDRVQALQNLSLRVSIPAVRALVAALVQAERFGTSLVDTLRTIAEEQRTERMMRAEEKAARLPALITLPLIFFIMPALFMVILGPVFIKIGAQGGLSAMMGGG